MKIPGRQKIGMWLDIDTLIGIKDAELKKLFLEKLSYRDIELVQHTER